VHFGLITLSVLPEQAVPGPVEKVSSDYADPLFRQEWSLFAPDPIDGDVQIFVRARASDGATWTEWTDIYGPIRDEVRGRPFSSQAFVRVNLLRSALAPIKVMFFDNDTLRERQELFLKWQQPGSRPAELTSLDRTASAAMAERFPDLDLEAVQTRLVLTLVPGDRQRPGQRQVPLRLTLPEAKFDPSVPPLSGK
jgi:hypothetical protein